MFKKKKKETEGDIDNGLFILRKLYFQLDYNSLCFFILIKKSSLLLVKWFPLIKDFIKTFEIKTAFIKRSLKWIHL